MKENEKGSMLVLKSSLEDFMKETTEQMGVIESLIKTLSEEPDSAALSASRLLECTSQYMQEVEDYSSGDPNEMLKKMCGVFGSIKLIEVIKDEVTKALNKMEESDGN